jgi:metal-dependent amidase/aminoacylase/carboxypeptidase family protein
MSADRAKLFARLEAIKPELIAIRRDIHCYPETGFEEARTAALVAYDLNDEILTLGAAYWVSLAGRALG